MVHAITIVVEAVYTIVSSSNAVNHSFIIQLIILGNSSNFTRIQLFDLMQPIITAD